MRKTRRYQTVDEIFTDGPECAVAALQRDMPKMDRCMLLALLGETLRTTEVVGPIREAARYLYDRVPQMFISPACISHACSTWIFLRVVLCWP